MSDGSPVVTGNDYSAPGKPAQHTHGVLYQGEFETPWDGTGAAVRLHARALASQGVPVLLRSFSNTVINEHGLAQPVHVSGIPAEVQDEVGHLLDTSLATCRPAIKHLVVRSAEHLRQVIMPRGAIPRTDDMNALIELKNSLYSNTILYTVWERDRIDHEIRKHLQRVADVWVPCEQNAAMLHANGVHNVFVVPHPYDPKDTICKLVQRKPHAPGFARFYSIGRWEPRKGFHELIGAFLNAFSADDNVALTIKYSGNGIWKDYPSPDESVHYWLQRKTDGGWTAEQVNQRVRLIGGKLPRSRIIELHFRNSIYVSASHGEAWNLPAWDAKLAGNYMVHVPWGGTADFADINDVRVPYALGAVHPSYGWGSDTRWATYQNPDLTQALRVAAREFWSGSPWATRPVQPIGLEERFSLNAVGKIMLGRINHLLEGSSIRYGAP